MSEEDAAVIMIDTAVKHIELARKVIDALMLCPCCDGSGKIMDCAVCPNCDGTGEMWFDPESKELIAEWRKRFPRKI